ncbi:MAG: hypothetical protein V4438_00575 [Patescibacteria group bacterium]
MQAPSKRIITLITCALIIVIAIGVNKFWPQSAESALVSPAYSAPDITKINAIKNGINGTEFLQSYATSSAATSTDNTPATLSRDIARSLFANTAYLDSSNSLDDASKEALVQNAINQIQNSFTYKEYSAEGLRYIDNADKDAIKAYASKFATLQIGMLLIMQNNVSKIETDLGVLGKIYAQEAEALYELKVPRDLAAAHLEIVNNFSRSAAAFAAFANKNDPLAIPLAMKAYQTAAAEQESLLGQIAQFIKSNDIIFTSNEAGGYWNAFGISTE